jgi:hypothetical protein
MVYDTETSHRRPPFSVGQPRGRPDTRYTLFRIVREDISPPVPNPGS